MSIGNIKDYTPNFKFIIPSFDIATWHDYIEENFRNIDALFYNLFGINNYSGTWKNITSYTVGQVLFVGEDKDLEGNDTEYAGRLVKVLVDHTTDNSDYFNIYYNLHPEYYELFADASTAQYYAQIAQENANITINLRQETESLFNFTKELRNDTQILRNDALLYRDTAEDFSKNAKKSADNAQVSAENAQDYLNLTQETYYSAINDINSTKSDAIIQIDQNTNQKIDEFINLSNKNTQTATNLLNQTQIAAQNAQNYANEAWGKISNVGDIFYSLRLDDELNGAVVCNGNYYELEDFTGTHSIKNLLEQNKLPYVSLEEYENTLNTYGSVRCFGYTPYTEEQIHIISVSGEETGTVTYRNVAIINGTTVHTWNNSINTSILYTLETQEEVIAKIKLGERVDFCNRNLVARYYSNGYTPKQTATQFRVPTLDDVYIKAGIANLPNEFNVESLPNITGNIAGLLNHSSFWGSGALSSALLAGSIESSYYGIASNYNAQIQKTSFDASRSSSTYKNGAKVNPDNVRYRAFVQLANAATENAVISATSAISKLADVVNKSDDQTINGKKTFEDKVTITSNTMHKLAIRSQDIDLDVLPTAQLNNQIYFEDKNGNMYATLQANQTTNGTVSFGLSVRRNTSSNYASFMVNDQNDDYKYATAPTPANTSNSNTIATTEWVRSKIFLDPSKRISLTTKLNSAFTIPNSGILALAIKVGSQTDASVTIQMVNSGTASANNGYTVTKITHNGGSAESNTVPIIFPVKKGQSIYLNYNKAGSATMVYAYLFRID